MNSFTHERLLVVKLGGAADVRHTSALRDCAAAVAQGAQLLIVHGGSAETSQLGHDVGHPPRMLTSPGGHESRYTDRRTLDLFTMASALVNRRLVGELQAQGVSAFGLSGLDGALMRGERKPALRSVENGRVRVVRDDWSGRITSVNEALVHQLLGLGLLPVIAPLAMTAEGMPLNVDGDRAAAAIASALGADALVLLTGANGLYRNFPDPDSRIREALIETYDELQGVAQGRMKRKVLAAKDAIEGGVPRVVIGASAAQHPLFDALAGAGTTLRAGSFTGPLVEVVR
ncbi:Acetylglutamate kinase [Planctomycetes bacterium Poly30]|uniref:Acetylglutamate kinase n=1 Tax=Saltatorellus ferox TaxID=2528018 RepID=A0A518EYN0_9BACT|nr:Acetylglutamate kinase [Planctomycetes bacterium Poly30]